MKDDSHQPIKSQTEPVHDHLFNFTIYHDDEIPIVSFCNQVNQIGYLYQNELFKDHHIFSTTNNFTITPLKDIQNNSFVNIQKEDNPPIDLFSTEFAKSEKNYHMVDLLKSLLHPNQKNDEAKRACSFFSKIIKELEELIKKVFDILKYVGDKLLIDLFANKNQINHISGNEWRNFGETLLNTPDFIFSDDTKDPVGFLLYENGTFYHTDGKDIDKKIKIGLHFPQYYYSPITKEHLVAISHLATSKNKVIKLFGSCHSWSPIHTTNGILVDNRRILIDPKSGNHYIKINEKDPRTDNPSISYKGKPQTTVTTSPGITTGTLEKAIWKLGYSLEASTIEDVFTMAGIGVTSSHGTGKKCTVLSDLVIAMTFVCSNGKIVEVSPQECVEVNGNERKPATWLLEKDGKKLTPEDIWRAAQVNLGAFGIVYDMTILVQPKIHALFVSQAAKWADYFGTDPSCAKNLNNLNNEWDTLEFWHFPFTVDNIYQPSILQLLRGTVTHTPYVTITKTMTNNLSEKQKLLYDTVDKNYNSPEFVAQLAFQSVGAQFASRIWKWANTLYNNPLFKKVGLFMIKFIALMCSWVGKINWGKEPSFDSEGKLITKGEVWRIPQWIANHPVLDATAVVELIPVLDIEWEVPVPSFDEKGFTNVIGAFGNLIRNVKDRFENHNEFPVTINCEMRFLRGSNCPLSMQYNHQPLLDSEEGKGIVDRGFAAPEIVSNSPNPWWVDFYNEMNKQTTCYQQPKKNYGENIRTHHAKQFSSLQGMLGHLRGIYDSPEFSKYPNNSEFNTSFKLWKEVRTRFDQTGTFINPYIDQLFYNYQDTYNKPMGFEVSEGGDVQSHHHCSIL